MKKNKLCYNCTGAGHSAANCKSRICSKCSQKHHTSLCERQHLTMSEQTTEKNMSKSNNKTSTIHATVKANVKGEKVRIMIDTGASSSYVCSDLVTKHFNRPSRKETRCIEQMFGTATKRVEIHRISIFLNAVEGFSFVIDCINAEKPVLTYLPNPGIEQLKQRYPRLRRLQFSDEGAPESHLTSTHHIGSW